MSLSARYEKLNVFGAHGRRRSCPAGGRNDPLSLARRAHAATKVQLTPEQRAMNGAFYADV